MFFNKFASFSIPYFNFLTFTGVGLALSLIKILKCLIYSQSSVKIIFGYLMVKLPFIHIIYTLIKKQFFLSSHVFCFKTVILFHFNLVSFLLEQVSQVLQKNNYKNIQEMHLISKAKLNYSM